MTIKTVFTPGWEPAPQGSKARWAHLSESAHYACPRCAGATKRIRRRLIDRLLGLVLVMPLQRHACAQQNSCGWSGNLRRVPHPHRSAPRVYSGRSHRV